MKQFSRIGLFAGFAVAVLAMGSERADAAVLLSTPTVQHQKWSPSGSLRHVSWDVDTVVMGPGKLAPARGKPRLRRHRTVGSTLLNLHPYEPFQSIYSTPSPLGPLVASDVAGSQDDSNTSTAIAFKRGRKFASTQEELSTSSIASRVINTSRQVLSRANAHSSVNYAINRRHGLLYLSGRADVRDGGVAGWRKRSITSAHSRVAREYVFDVTRDAYFDVKTMLAATRQAQVDIAITDNLTGETLFSASRARRNRAREVTVEGLLTAGQYTVSVTADTSLRRHRSRLIENGGAAFFGLRLEVESLLSDEELLRQARYGDPTLEELMANFALDEETLAFNVAANRFDDRYLREFTGLSGDAYEEYLDAVRAKNPSFFEWLSSTSYYGNSSSSSGSWGSNDYSGLLSNWGSGVTTANPATVIGDPLVPEPTSAMLLVTAGGLLLMRRRQIL